MDLTLLQQLYLTVADLFLWGRRIDFTAWFKGEWLIRDKQSERILPILERKRLIHSQWYQGMKVYTTSKRRSFAHVPHGLMCTLALLRFKHSKEGEFIPESFFRKAGFRTVPEWAVRYEANALLVEYSTTDNCRRSRLMTNKVRSYKKHLHQFDETLGVPCRVLFVLNTPRHDVEYFADKNRGHNFFYVDSESFFAVQKGEQLTAPIYIWGGNGQVTPLSAG